VPRCASVTMRVIGLIFSSGHVMRYWYQTPSGVAYTDRENVKTVATAWAATESHQYSEDVPAGLRIGRIIWHSRNRKLVKVSSMAKEMLVYSSSSLGSLSPKPKILQVTQILEA
jgi:hypothetical protein